MQWKSVVDAVKNDSAAIKALKGRRVRLKQQIISPTFEPNKPNLRGPESTFAKGAEGFVGYASLEKDFMPVGFPLEGEKLPDNFDQLLRKQHRVLPDVVHVLQAIRDCGMKDFAAQPRAEGIA